MKLITDIIKCFVFGLIAIFTIFGIYSFFHKTDNKTPVEESITIDSLITTNHDIKIKVELLDSVRNAKVIEVSNLNNDSTVKLFFELVSE